VKTDLWLAASIAADLMDLFYRVNKGRNAIGFTKGFSQYLMQLERDTAALRAEMMATDRFPTGDDKSQGDQSVSFLAELSLYS
jgi:hypothetical protein